uniref:Uncharacterized protein n=1 Tax=Rhizophora mucronata TaxID=61149 RepID=A0A2P2JWR7_RHIMU
MQHPVAFTVLLYCSASIPAHWKQGSSPLVWNKLKFACLQ